MMNCVAGCGVEMPAIEHQGVWADKKHAVRHPASESSAERKCHEQSRLSWQVSSVATGSARMLGLCTVPTEGSSLSVSR